MTVRATMPTVLLCRAVFPMGQPSKIIREAIEFHIELLAKRSKEISQAEKLVRVEEISIGLPDN